MTDAPEDVLVVPRHIVVPGDGWLGVRPADHATFENVVAAHGDFRPRSEMEVDPGFKQIIPYLVLRNSERYFLMRRTQAGADARLHDRYSIGIGGHLNPGDRDLAGGLEREWSEEIAATFVPTFRFIGLLNDDTTEVGAVHLGAIYLADAGGRDVAIRETAKLTGDFASAADVAKASDRMETWSALVFTFLEGDGTR